MRALHYPVLATGLALWYMAPFASLAQTASRADLEYCAALSSVYTRYIGWDETTSQRQMNSRGSLDGQVAVAKCKQGDTASAIPTLEKILVRQGFSLPRRR